MAKHAGGRPSVFRKKKGGTRYQGVLTKTGASLFEDRRSELAQIVERPVKAITDADVIEFLARGRANTLEYLSS
jgi:hypothetical protein